MSTAGGGLSRTASRRGKTAAELGIDDTQQDVYEYDGEQVAAAEGASEPPGVVEKEHEDLDRGSLDKAAATQFFKKHATLPDGDFSSSSRGQRYGYITASGVGGKEEETPSAQFRRIRTELVMLEEKMKELGVGDAGAAHMDIPPGFCSDIRKLQEKLRAMTLPAALKMAPFEQVVRDQITQLRAPPTTTTTTTPSTTELTQLTHLEARIAQLESRVGVTDLSNAYPDLTTAIDDLETRVALVQPGFVDKIKTQLVQLERDALRRKKKDGDDGAPIDDAQLVGLYQTVQRWSAVSAQLPALVSRLHSLRTLHEQSAAVYTTVTRISEEQGAIVSKLDAQKAALQHVTDSLASNMQSVTKNITSIESRLAAIEAKLASK